MKNITHMFKQVQALQEKMTKAQEQLEDMEVAGKAGGGMVEIVLSGKGNARRVTIDPTLVVATEKDVLEDLLTAAFNDARTNLEEKVSAEMKAVTGGIELPPGFKMPF